MVSDELVMKQLAQLKQAAKIFLRLMEQLPFPVVVEAMTGHQIIPYVKQDDAIIYDARHFLCGFSITESAEKKWILQQWTVTDLWHLQVKLKPEYNANNLEIYRADAVLMKGDGKTVVFHK